MAIRAIKSFKGKNAFLSNFHPCAVEFGGEIYATTEAAYQAAKTLDEEWREKIRNAETPEQAKGLGKKAPLRPDWMEISKRVMGNLLSKKFQAGTDLGNMLLATEERQLVEGNTWHDNRWGNCSCKKCRQIESQNLLGEMLMYIRSRTRRIYPNRCAECGTLLPSKAFCWDHWEAKTIAV